MLIIISLIKSVVKKDLIIKMDNVYQLLFLDVYKQN